MTYDESFHRELGLTLTTDPFSSELFCQELLTDPVSPRFKHRRLQNSGRLLDAGEAVNRVGFDRTHGRHQGLLYSPAVTNSTDDLSRKYFHPARPFRDG